MKLCVCMCQVVLWLVDFVASWRTLMWPARGVSVRSRVSACAPKQNGYGCHGVVWCGVVGALFACVSMNAKEVELRVRECH